VTGCRTRTVNSCVGTTARSTALGPWGAQGRDRGPGALRRRLRGPLATADGSRICVHGLHEVLFPVRHLRGGGRGPGLHVPGSAAGASPSGGARDTAVTGIQRGVVPALRGEGNSVAAGLAARARSEHTG